MGWKRSHYKGDEVWIETDSEGEPIIKDGQVFMKYNRDADAKIYTPHADKIAETEADARDDWRARLEAREEELDEREKQLEAREQSLDEREEALREWEERLKSRAIEGEPAEPSIRRTDTERPDFLEDLEPVEPELVEIHTDGACSGNPGPCASAVVVRTSDNYEEWGEFLGEGTNNIAELRAIQAGLESVEDRTRPVRVYTDSRYAIGVLSQGWEAKANTELIEEIRELLHTFENVELRKVEGHAGEPLNERADDLAKEAIPD